MNILEIPIEELQMRDPKLELVALYPSEEGFYGVLVVWKNKKQTHYSGYCALSGHRNVNQSKSEFDVIRKPKRLQGWVNVYPNGLAYGYFDDREQADQNVIKGRIACIDLSQFTEGEGL